jgi:hypothetical protein
MFRISELVDQVLGTESTTSKVPGLNVTFGCTVQ